MGSILSDSMRNISSSKSTALRAGIFLLAVVLLYGACSDVLSVNNPADQHHIHGFYLEPKNSLDVVFLGASELYTGFCAPLAWEKYGFTSYPLAVSSMLACLYRPMLAETLRRQNPKIIVVEINAFLYDFDQQDIASSLRRWLDNTPMSANKLATIRALVPKAERMSYFLRLEKYHDNWRTPRVWGGALVQRLAMDRTGYSLTKGLEVFPTIDTDDVEPKFVDMSAANEQALRDFCAYAKSLGVENLLFVRFPHRSMVADPTVLPRMQSVIADCGYPFLDLDTNAEALGFDRYHDFCDTEHMNVFGMERFTDYFGKYLAEHYDLSGTHSDRVTAQWDRCAAFVHKMLPVCEQKTPADTKSYFNEFSPEFRAWR